MKEFFENKFVKWTLGILGVLSVLVLIIGSFFSSMDVDSAIILVEMERIAEGYIPYKTMHLNYPPLWFYINVALKWLFHVPYGCYPFYLGVHWLYAIGCASCLYYISRQWGASKYISAFVAWLFFIVSHWPQGNEILFEIPSVFWGLLAISLFLKWKDSYPAWQIIVGAITCCSFLTKQFGAGFLMLVLWLIVTSTSENKWKQTGFYLLGYCLPLLICLACWGTDIYRSILFNGYGTDVMDAYWGRETTFASKIARLWGNLLLFANRLVPHIYVAISLLPFMFVRNKWREALCCFFGIGGFLLQFFFVHGGHHYFQYMLPFALLLIPIMLSLDLNKYVRVAVWGIIGWTTMLGMYSAYHNRVWKRYLHEGKRDYENQWKMGAQIASIVQDGETVFIPHGGICYLYYTANLYPSCMAEIGYGVGPMEVDIEHAAKWVANTDYVLHFTRKLMYDLYQGKDFEYFYNDSIQQYVDQFPSDTFGTAVVLHYLNRPKLEVQPE